MLFNAEAQRTQREAQRTQERPRRRAGEWPVPRVVTREPRILFLPQFLFRLLCAYLCVLCVSALNTHSGLVTEWRLSAAPRDRKSTRLNSSHLGISYAVFC